eukprot:SAG11_NODE_7900_length_1083_cov_0.783537_1_plen_110_part_00
MVPIVTIFPYVRIEEQFKNTGTTGISMARVLVRRIFEKIFATWEPAEHLANSQKAIREFETRAKHMRYPSHEHMLAGEHTLNAISKVCLEATPIDERELATANKRARPY